MFAAPWMLLVLFLFAAESLQCPPAALPLDSDLAVALMRLLHGQMQPALLHLCRRTALMVAAHENNAAAPAFFAPEWVSPSESMLCRQKEQKCVQQWPLRRRVEGRASRQKATATVHHLQCIKYYYICVSKNPFMSDLCMSDYWEPISWLKSTRVSMPMLGGPAVHHFRCIIRWSKSVSQDASCGCRRPSISLHEMPQREHPSLANASMNSALKGQYTAQYVQEKLIFYICTFSLQSVVKYLLEAGAPPCEQDAFGITALYEAVRMGHTEVIEVLQKYDANILPGDWVLLKALHLAPRNNTGRAHAKAWLLLGKRRIEKDF
eukprot:scaffold29063_cov20-Tisochrysis_lutea.AAC.1